MRDSNREVKKMLKNNLLKDDQTKSLLPIVQKSKIWTEDEDAKIIKHYEELHSWKYVSNQFCDRTPVQCKQRWYRFLRPQEDCIKTRWNPIEDQILKDN